MSGSVPVVEWQDHVTRGVFAAALHCGANGLVEWIYACWKRDRAAHREWRRKVRDWLAEALQKGPQGDGIVEFDDNWRQTLCEQVLPAAEAALALLRVPDIRQIAEQTSPSLVTISDLYKALGELIAPEWGALQAADLQSAIRQIHAAVVREIEQHPVREPAIYT